MASSFLIRLKIRKKRYAIMGTIAIVLNYMQDAPDCIKVQKLNNPYPCNDYWWLEWFTILSWHASGVQRSRWEDLTIQVKNISQGTWAHPHQGREIIAIGALENGAFCTVFSENFHKF
jgi:hypothetical protein